MAPEGDWRKNASFWQRMSIWFGDSATNAAGALYILGFLATFLMMILLVAAGILEIWRGTIPFLDGSEPHSVVPNDAVSHMAPTTGTVNRMDPAANAIVQALKGFEFLLLAPLPPAIIISVGRYLRGFLTSSPEGKPQHEGDSAESGLHRVETLVSSLMVSVVATELLRQFLSPVVLEDRRLVLGGSLFVLMISYIILRQLILDRHR